ncbi:type II secretion system minor pseudopilin GspJ [Parvularcula sp. ZS-1/3]|uniref:Type II secretion system protein J n=1 Tax=Parvularcula mediterranea TaxID=2732508 RepID=A0A7Y3W691_9PROT|nr:type II secretion system minor pseudopilin GspJ [Parvularcula mediterranea]NNU17107.1 type II secretion system minor pseudopilin GspJ [Parvularcula mediterranea]
MNERGVTLIEVLIALGIFAAVNVIAVTAFSIAANGSRQLEEVSDRIAAMERFRGVLRADLHQLVERPVWEAETTRPRPSLMGGPVLEEVIGDDGFEPLLALVRSGWANPGAAEPRAEVQAVTYIWANGQIIRRTRPFLDADIRTPFQDDVLVDGARDVEIAFRIGGRWEEDAGRSANPGDRPLAVRLTFTHDVYGEMEHVFLLGGTL